MRKIKEVLRLKYGLGLKNREIARSCSIPRSSVANYLSRAKGAGLTWPVPVEWDDTTLERRLFPPLAPPAERQPMECPDFAAIHEERRRHKHLTLQLLWQEYKQNHPEGYQYSRFCELYHRWARQLDLVLRQEHRAGERLFVDHAGPTVAVVHGETGQVQEASIFVAVLGASNYTYAEATGKRDLASWIGSHVRALEFFGGVPAAITPDNWKTAVHHPCYYEPDLNPTYRDFAEHYGTVILPARVRKPRDKAAVENGVLVVERWILAALRHRTFFSVGELNEAIQELLVHLNHRPFRKLDTTRARMFEELERGALQPLPGEPFTFAEWKKARVHPDYHVEVERHYYSVPYPYVGEEVEVRLSEAVIEIFRHGQRITTHARSTAPGKATTRAEHRPQKHQDLQWTGSQITAQGAAVGPSTRAVLERILAAGKYPEVGYRSCLGILRLGARYTNERLEAACRRALAMNVASYKSLHSILEAGLDRQPLQQSQAPPVPAASHSNVRGAGYYAGTEVA